MPDSRSQRARVRARSHTSVLQYAHTYLRINVVQRQQMRHATRRVFALQVSKVSSYRNMGAWRVAPAAPHGRPTWNTTPGMAAIGRKLHRLANCFDLHLHKLFDDPTAAEQSRPPVQASPRTHKPFSFCSPSALLAVRCPNSTAGAPGHSRLPLQYSLNTSTRIHVQYTPPLPPPARHPLQGLLSRSRRYLNLQPQPDPSAH